jgi:hypothetical protein
MVLEWVKASVDDLTDMDDSFLYALVRSRRLLYIGMSYHTDVAMEVKQNMASFSMSARNLNVYLGYWERGNVARVTRPLIHDIEALLIFDNQPKYNTHHMADYTGRAGLRVTNKGCPYLKKMSTSDWHVD